MSIGNLKDQGNKGNNFPYQLRNLQLLGAINEGIIDLNGSIMPNYAGPMAVDAFGRERVSEPFTLGDYKHIYGLNTNFLDKLSNGGTVTFIPNESSALLATSLDPLSRAIHQTKLYHAYMPGKSQLIYSTFCFKAAVANVTKRTGYFDDYNGIYFEQNGEGTLSFNVRTNTSGTPIGTRIVQSSWNVDKCDGTGPSGYDLDITKTQFFFTDFTWLGLGRVRCGFLVNGSYVVAHEFNTSNTIDVPYMANPNLPVRCEIFNTGIPEEIGSFNQICSSVISEGGYIETGQDYSTLNTTLRTVAAGATVPLLAIRLTNTYQTYLNRLICKLEEFSFYSVKEPLYYKVIKLPNVSFLTGGSWTAVNSNSGIEYNDGATAYTDGKVFASGYVSAAVGNRGSVNSDSSASNARENYIAQNFDSTDSEIYMIAVTNLGTTSTTVGCAMQWREIY